MNEEFGYLGKFFEDLKVGEIIVHKYGRTVTYDLNLLFTNFLLNDSPLHSDSNYMEKTEFKQILLLSSMTLAVAIGIASLDFKNVVWDEGIYNVKFLKPVFNGDTLRVITEIMELREHEERKELGIVKLKHEVYKNGYEEKVCEFERVIWLLKKEYFK
jgi:itaconyl-CoA hydratase